ncbi:sensor domain-containing protein [Thetidibacter halocola]|uniref:EAL domain-containing protein n=1 Tax=Thetidibacter halocola TaxID=2827239 RepID=A0A8J7WDN0_9RHOB|nr:EAL domain-containing protein [Thetidibacter halocola]MBS0125695.1 EAL domain-containing protein [Thetidibacter halocola]
MNLKDLLENYIELSPDAVMIARRDSVAHRSIVHYVNPAFQAAFGWSPETIIGRPAAETLSPDAREAFYADLNARLAAGQDHLAIETSCVRADGSPFWAVLSMRVLYQPDGSLMIVSTHRDVSELKEKERRASGALLDNERMLAELEAVQQRLVSALESYPDPFVIYDKSLCLVQCNQAYRKAMARDPDRIRPGMPVADVLNIAIDDGLILPPEGDRDRFVSDILQHGCISKTVLDIELANDTHHRILRSRSSAGDHVIIRVDTTELVRQRRAAEESRARLINALNAYPAPFAIYDRDRLLVTCNESYLRSFTDTPEEISTGMHVREVLTIGLRHGRFPDALGREDDWIAEKLDANMANRPFEDLELAGDIHQRVLRSRAENGDILLVRIDTTELVRQRRSIEEYARMLEQANKAILHDAFHDQLTGLGNRRFLQNQFRRLSKRREFRGGELAALHVDLDRFKQINDTIGHAAGDHVLTVVAERIRANIAKSDVVARIGGDEFVILLYLSETDLDRPEVLARTLLEALSRPTVFEGRECRFGASVGIARTPLADETDLLPDSDIALYKAKRGGRGQYAVFDQSDLNEMRRVKAVADDIILALERAEFVPYLQPQVDAHSGAFVGLEALARWQHPERGILSPDTFLDVAADLNVLADIDRMIFEKAIDSCATLFRDWPDPPSLSFNVSIKRVLSGDIDHIGRTASRYPGKVAFELLETIFLEEADTEFLMKLDHFRELGLTIEVDDFGSGRASVVALQRIAPHRLKIDSRLVAPLTETPSAERLVRSIVEIGHALEIGVTAEGVETPEQARLLSRLGCDRLQGYHFGAPMGIDDLGRYAARIAGMKRTARHD